MKGGNRGSNAHAFFHQNEPTMGLLPLIESACTQPNIPALASNLCLRWQTNRASCLCPWVTGQCKWLEKHFLKKYMISHYFGCRCSFLAVYTVHICPGIFLFESTYWYCVWYDGFRQLYDSLVEIHCLSIIQLKTEYSFDTMLCLYSNYSLKISQMHVVFLWSLHSW